jgi:hypothetical protein
VPLTNLDHPLFVADGTMPPWCAGDEVYGRAGELRTFLGNEIGYKAAKCDYRARRPQ